MTELENQIRANKLEMINFLVEQLVSSYKLNEYKEYTIAEDADIPTLNAELKILRLQVKKAKLGKAKLVKFDKLEAERANLTPEQLAELKATQKRNDSIVDSYLATIEPRASLKGRIQAPESIILRYRGKSVNDEFSKKYPFGVLL